LDPVLLENIGFARYNNPTPVQKYSIPIVANNRDLMACAQVFFCCCNNLHRV
jgi:ATP-dependent RNA helicase DDX3X